MRSIEEEFEMGALLVKYRFPVNWLDFKRLLYIGDAGCNQVIQTSHGLFIPISCQYVAFKLVRLKYYIRSSFNGGLS